jgi:hypothetical protein
MQEFVREQANGCRSRVCGAGRGTRNGLGANGLRALGEREGIASPLTTPETGGLDGSGAKVAASFPRVEWGPTEAELLVGYARGDQ